MKLIARTVIFSAISLALTALIVKGFNVSFEPKTFILTTLILAFVYYIVKPITKLILLPFNILTMGLVSVVAYILIFYFVLTKLALAQISPWTFPGGHFYILSLPKFYFNYIMTVSLAAISYSFIINLLSKLL